MHIILYMLLSLNWVRGHIIAILRKGGWRKRSKGLLSFFDGFHLRFLFFHGLAGFCRAWLKAIYHLLSNSVPLLRPEFWHQIGTSFHGYLRPKNWNFFPISSDEKGTTSGFRVLANHLSSSSSTSPCHAIHSGYYTDLCIPFSVHPVTV